MTSKADFTPQEWTMLLLAPVQTGMAVLLSSSSGLIGTAKEAMALYNATNKRVAQQYPQNSLIQELLSSNNDQEDKHVFQKVKAYISDNKARQQVKPEALQTCRNIAMLLSQRVSPQEAEGYKQWLMDVSTKVASASSENGHAINDAERMTLKEIADALGTVQTPTP